MYENAQNEYQILSKNQISHHNPCIHVPSHYDFDPLGHFFPQILEIQRSLLSPILLTVMLGNVFRHMMFVI